MTPAALIAAAQGGTRFPVAVRVDGVAVPASAWSSRMLHPGAVVEWTRHSGEQRAVYDAPRLYGAST